MSTECGTCVGAEYSCRPGMHGMELMRPKQAFGSTAPTQPTQPTSPHPSGVSPECHVWCEDSCGSLNGDVVVECGGCQGDSFACRPGASDFPVAAAARTPLHGSLSPVESWPTLFESDGRFSGCISSACMQKNGALLEQAALAAEEFSFAPSKGGDDGACELPQLSHVDIEKMTPAQRANALRWARHRHGPPLRLGCSLMASPAALRRLPRSPCHPRAPLRLRLGACGGGETRREQHVDGRGRATMALPFGAHADPREHLHECGGGGALRRRRGVHKCCPPHSPRPMRHPHLPPHSSLTLPDTSLDPVPAPSQAAAPVPSLFGWTSLNRFVSLGGGRHASSEFGTMPAPHATRFNRVDGWARGWLGLIAGVKRWALAPPRPGQREPSPPSCGGEGMPFGAEGGDKVVTCTQRPGDVISIPSGWWRSVCNLEAYTLGVGAKKEAKGAEFAPWSTLSETRQFHLDSARREALGIATPNPFEPWSKQPAVRLPAMADANGPPRRFGSIKPHIQMRSVSSPNRGLLTQSWPEARTPTAIRSPTAAVPRQKSFNASVGDASPQRQTVRRQQHPTRRPTHGRRQDTMSIRVATNAAAELVVLNTTTAGYSCHTCACGHQR